MECVKDYGYWGRDMGLEMFLGCTVALNVLATSVKSLLFPRLFHLNIWVVKSSVKRADGNGGFSWDLKCFLKMGRLSWGVHVENLLQWNMGMPDNICLVVLYISFIFHSFIHSRQRVTVRSQNVRFVPLKFDPLNYNL